MTKENKWTDEEVNTLIKKYRYMKVKYIQKYIPRRSVVAIYAKARSLKLRAYPSMKECKLFIAMFHNEKSSRIAELTGMNYRSICYYRSMFNKDKTNERPDIERKTA